jgi:hypothetical protein
MATRQEREANARFSQRYGEERGDVVRAIELASRGSDPLRRARHVTRCGC